MTDFVKENFYAELCDIFHQLRNLQEDAQLLGWVKTEKDIDYIADEVLDAIKNWQKEITEQHPFSLEPASVGSFFYIVKSEYIFAGRKILAHTSKKVKKFFQKIF